jgi:tol-pal system protein YbgF
MLKRLLSALVAVCLSAVAPLEAQKSQKVYELIYQDIQAIKQQLLDLNQQVQRNSEDIQALAEQLSEVLRLSRDARRDFAGFQAEQKSLPAQYQILLERYDAIRTELAGITERLIEIQRAALTPAQEEGQPQTEEQPSTEQDTAKEVAAEQADEGEEKPKTTLPPNLSPQEVYNMARSDYLKGNFQLAVQGFSMYKEHFSESPLVDNAQYWIGECYFSQEDYEEAITQFNDLILNFPQGDKIAAAYLKKGFSLANLGKTDEALAVLKLLVSKFPLEDESKIAQQKIQELEKHP